MKIKRILSALILAMGLVLNSTSTVQAGTFQLTVTLAGDGSGIITMTSNLEVISCPPTCTATFVDTPVTLTATTPVGSVFGGWFDNPSCSGTGPCNLPMLDNTTVTATFTLDGTLPTVSLDSLTSNPTNSGSIPVTILFSEPVIGFDQSDIKYSPNGGVSISGFAVVSASEYKFSLDITGERTATVNILAGAATDLARNPNLASLPFSRTTDTTPPLLSLAAPATNTFINSISASSDVSYSSNEALSNGIITITPTGGPDGTTHTCTLIGSALSSGTHSSFDMSNAANGCASPSPTLVSGSIYTFAFSGTDIAGNPAGAANKTGITFDTTPPAFSAVSPDTSALINNITTASDVSYTLNETLASGAITITRTGGTNDGSSPHTCTLTSTALTGVAHAPFNMATGCTTGPSLVSGAIYTFAFSGADTAGNPAATVTTTNIAFDSAGPSVTINQAAAQADPTNASSINFTVVFSEAVTGFSNSDVTLTGTTAPPTANVTGGPTTYNVAVSGMTVGGTVTASIPASVAQDGAGNLNQASTSTDNSVVYDIDPPAFLTVAPATNAFINNITNPSAVSYTLSETLFSGAITITRTGGTADSSSPHLCTLTSGALTSGAHNAFNMATGCTAAPTLVSGAVYTFDFDGTDLAGNPAPTYTSSGVTFDSTAPTVTIIQAAAQADPTNVTPINFTVQFNEVVTGFTNTDVTLGGTAGPIAAAVTFSGTTYNVAVSGMTASGTVTASIPASVAQDAAGNSNQASTSTDNTVSYDIAPMTVTINQATAQADPTNASSINFTVIFSKSTLDFQTGDVTLGSTAGTVAAVVTGSGTNYNVAVTGMTVSGTVTASIADSVAHDTAGNPNQASTSSDNSVIYDIAPPVFSAVAPAQNTYISNITTASDVSYTLNETLASGTIQINRTGGTADVNHTCTLTGSALSGSAHAAFNMATGCTAAPTLLNGAIYTFTFSGTDAAGNSAVPVSSSGVTFDNGLPAFPAIAPATNAFINNITTASDVSYTLNETLASGVITISRTGGTADDSSPHTCTLTGTALSGGAHAAFDMSNSTNGCTLAPVLASGAIYTFTFSGTDLAGNVAVPASTTGVTFDSTPPVFSAIAPGMNAFINSISTASDVSYTLGETLASGAIVMTWTSGIADASPTHTCTLAGTALNIGAHTGLNMTDTTNACAALQTLVNGATYTFTFNGMDRAGNPAPTVTNTGITFDTTAPTVTFTLQPTSDSGALATDNITNVDPLVFNAAFNEAITGFIPSDLTYVTPLAGCTLNIGPTSTNSYPITVSGCSEGALTLRLKAASVTDLAGNSIAQIDGPLVTIDRTGPTVNLGSSTLDPTAVFPIPVTVTFNEAVADFIAADITLTPASATLDGFTGTGTTYSFGLYPGILGTVSADIPAAMAHDTAGNANTPATTFSRVYDSVRPTVSITSTTSLATNLSPIPVTVTFSKTVTGFIKTDLTVTNGSFTLLNGSGSVYTFDLIPAGQGAVTVDIAQNVAQDAAGNLNTTAATFNRTYDTLAPVFSSVNPVAGAFINNVTTSSDIGYSLSEALLSGTITILRTGGAADPAAHTCALTGASLNIGVHALLDLSNTINGCVQAQTLVSNAKYTFTFNGNDPAGNAAAPIVRGNVTFDSAGPTVSIGAPSAASTMNGPITFTVTYADPNFNTSSLTLAKITLTTTPLPSDYISGIVSVDSGTGSVRTVTVSNINGNGTLGISIAAGTASDKAGNLAPAPAASTRVLVDNTDPSVHWTGPVTDGTAYTVRDPNVILEVNANDNVAISQVDFRLWDPDANGGVGAEIQIGRVVTAPYRITFDASVLTLPGNEIDVYAYDTVGNYAVSAIYLNHIPTLIVHKTGTGQGIVTNSDSKINCGPACAYGFDSPSLVTLTATPVAGSVFAGWSGACSGKGLCQVTMSADKTVTANFISPYIFFLPFIKR